MTERDYGINFKTQGAEKAAADARRVEDALEGVATEAARGVRELTSGDVDAAGDTFSRVEGHARGLRTAIRDASEATEDLAAEGKKDLGKFDADLEGVQRSAATLNKELGGTRKSAGNAGLAILEGSRALEDLQYGIRGVLNNLPQLALHLGLSAGVAGAVSLLAVALVQLGPILSSRTGDLDDQAEAAAEATERINAYVKSLRSEAAKASQEEITTALDKQLRIINELSASQTQQLALEEQLAAATARRAESEREVARARIVAGGGGPGELAAFDQTVAAGAAEAELAKTARLQRAAEIQLQEAVNRQSAISLAETLRRKAFEEADAKYQALLDLSLSGTRDQIAELDKLRGEIEGRGAIGRFISNDELDRSRLDRGVRGVKASGEAAGLGAIPAEGEAFDARLKELENLRQSLLSKVETSAVATAQAEEGVTAAQRRLQLVEEGQTQLVETLQTVFSNNAETFRLNLSTGLTQTTEKFTEEARAAIQSSGAAISVNQQAAFEQVLGILRDGIPEADQLTTLRSAVVAFGNGQTDLNAQLEQTLTALVRKLDEVETTLARQKTQIEAIRLPK